MVLYEDYEIKTSKRNLAVVLLNVKEPVCLLGGWAVYLTVNARYKESTGMEYLGSKDIDLGFHFSKTQTPESIRQSSYAASIEALKQMGFYGRSFRMIQAYHRETGKRLSQDEAKKVPLYNIFDLYVDPLFDNIPDKFHETMGFQPLDEPLLRTVFEEEQYAEVDEFGARFFLPTPSVLLATKIKALPGRNKGHKRHKDIADIYALFWYSGVPPEVLESDLLRHVSSKNINVALSDITEEEYEKTAEALGISPHLLKDTFSIYTTNIPSKKMKRAEAHNSKWVMPFALGYDAFVKISRSLFQQKADTKAVSVTQICSITSLSLRLMKANFRFLKSVGMVVDDSPRSYRLTQLGAAYAKAHAMKDNKALKQTSLEIIKNSHLKALSDMLDLNPECSLDKIYAWIKTHGRYPDGSSQGNMHATESTGARTLIRIFHDAGLVSDTLVTELDSTSKPASKKRRTARPRRTPTGSTSSFGSVSVNGIGNVEVVDIDTLELAESYLKILRKKLTKIVSDTESG